LPPTDSGTTNEGKKERKKEGKEERKKEGKNERKERMRR